MQKSVPIALSAIMATSLLGVPAMAAAQQSQTTTPASEASSQQVNLTNCQIRLKNSLNYSSLYIEGKEPKSSDFEVVNDSGQQIDSSLYSLVFFTYDDDYEKQETDKVPSKVGEHHVYAKAKKGSEATGSTDSCYFRIVSKNDLAGMSLQFKTQTVMYTGKPIAPNVTLIDSDGKEVDKANYSLRYSDKDWKDLSYTPTECGEYHVNAQAVSGSGYTGSTNSYYTINVIDPSDISSFDFYPTQGAIITGTEPTFSSYLSYTDENGSYVSIDLKQGTDYVVVGYCTSLESSDYSENPPTNAGDYYAVLQGKGSYKGTKKVKFSARDANDMSLCHLSFNGDFVVNESLSADSFAVYDMDNKKLDQSIYKLVFSQNEKEIEGYPTEVGWYSVKAVAKEGSGKIGETATCTFQIVDPLDLSNLYPTDSTYLPAGYEPSFTLSFRGQTCYQQDKDFAIDHFESQGGINLGSKCPKDAGLYTVVLIPTRNSKLHGEQRVLLTLRNPLSLDGITPDYSQGYTDNILIGTKPPLQITSVAGEILDSNTDYDVSYYKNGKKVESISEPGTYQWVATAKEGSGLSGASQGSNFYVVDPADISNYRFSSNPVVGADDSLDLCLTYLSSDGTSHQMPIGSNTEYEITKVVDKNGNDVGTSVPSKAGEYTFTIKGKGHHYGTLTQQVAVFNSNDLQLCNMEYSSPKVPPNQGTIFLPLGNKLKIKVTNKQGTELTEGRDYEFEYAKVDDSIDWDDLLSNDKYWSKELPKTSNLYYVRLAATSSSTYHGATQIFCCINYGASNDLNQMSVSFGSNVKPSENEWDQTIYTVPFTGSDVDTGLTIKNGSTVLKEGQDYTVAMANRENPGSTQMTIEGKGKYTGTVYVNMYIVADLSDPNLLIEEVPAQTYDSIKKRPLPKLTLNGYTFIPRDAYDVAYSNNIEPGQATITFTGNGIYQGCTGTATREFTISPLSIKDAKVNVVEDATYNGSEQKPKVKVTLGNKTLKEGEDYNVTYKDNIDAGTATAVIGGTGRYGDSVEQAFQIAPADISKAKVSVSSQSYTGSEIEPDLNVTLNGKTLVKDKDYSVKFSNNVQIGEAQFTLTGKGNYKGTADGTFKIAKNLVDIATAQVEPASSCTYTGKAIEPELKVTCNGKELKLDSDYTVHFSNNSNAGSAEYILYGKGDYKGTLKGNFTIMAADISGATVDLNENSYAYDGSEHKPHATVTLKGFKLSQDSDFTLEYANNINAGTATATISGTGNYIGKITKDFTIAPADISSAKIVADKQRANGSELKPKPTVSLADRTLVEGQDYQVSGYENNINPGNATVSIAGVGNYTGTASGTFEITKAVDEGLNRVSGKLRYDTMSALTKQGGWETGGTVILAFGGNYPDALTAASLAGDSNSPILLTEGNGLSPQAAEEIQQLRPSKVIIVGGPAVITDSVKNSVVAAAPGATVQRIWGETRYETATNILGELNNNSSTAIVTTGTNFADALSVSPYAFATHAPIVLSDPNNGLTDQTINELKAKNVSNVIIIGGQNAVPQKVETQLATAGLQVSKRIAGSTRFETSQMIADFELADDSLGFKADGIILATGNNFPDALTAGPLGGRNRTPLLLVDTGAQSAASWLAKHNGEISGSLLVGGDNAISSSDVATLRKAMGI